MKLLDSSNEEPANILILDGNAFDRTQLQRAVASDRWNTVLAKTPEEALTLCNHHEFEVMFLEVRPMVPESILNISRIRSSPFSSTEAAIITMSSYTTDGLVRRVMQAGADLHISKPFPLSEVMTVVSDAISARHAAKLGPETAQGGS